MYTCDMCHTPHALYIIYTQRTTYIVVYNLFYFFIIIIKIKFSRHGHLSLMLQDRIFLTFPTNGNSK